MPNYLSGDFLVVVVVSDCFSLFFSAISTFIAPNDNNNNNKLYISNNNKTTVSYNKSHYLEALVVAVPVSSNDKTMMKRTPAS